MKIILKADKIQPGQCITISDDSFDQELLEDGHIYFLNTQKLGRSSRLVTGGDDRTWTIWQTLQNTAEQKGDHLYIVIDEAHRGMQDREAARATTIMQKFLKGSEADGWLPCQLSGMSARMNASAGWWATFLRFVMMWMCARMKCDLLGC